MIRHMYAGSSGYEAACHILGEGKIPRKEEATSTVWHRDAVVCVSVIRQREVGSGSFVCGCRAGTQPCYPIVCLSEFLECMQYYRRQFHRHIHGVMLYTKLLRMMGILRYEIMLI